MLKQIRPRLEANSNLKYAYFSGCNDIKGRPLSYTGVYINLDRSTARRAAMEAQIARYGLADLYRRLPAAEGNTLGVQTTLTNAQTGCLISHYLACKEHLGSTDYLHVVEDDVMFSKIMHKAIHDVIGSPSMDERDIMFLDSHMSMFFANGFDLRSAIAAYNQAIVRNHDGTIKNLNLSLVDYTSTPTSYLIRPHSVPKLLSVYEQLFTDGITMPVDLMLQKMGRDGTLRIGCLFPFVTSMRLDETATTIDDIPRRACQHSPETFCANRSLSIGTSTSCWNWLPGN